MPTDMPVALQVPATFANRLALSVGQQAVVYVMHVKAPSIQAAPGCPPCPPYPAPPTAPTAPPAASPGTGTNYQGPPLTPGSPTGGGHVTPMAAWICPPGAPPMMTTATVSGTLAFAGTDYLVIRVPATGGACTDVLIPYNAVGMIVLPAGI